MKVTENDIRRLIDRFMAGETSLEEEALVGKWFQDHPDVSDDLKDYQAMFGYFDEGMPLDDMAGNKAEVPQPKVKTSVRRLWLPLSIAASIVLLLALAIPRMGQQDDKTVARLESEAIHESANSVADSTAEATDSNLSIPEKVKAAGDSASIKSGIRKQKKYRQHMYAPAPPRVFIAQNAVSDSLLAEPDMLAEAHLREMEEQQNEMFFKLYLVNALQTASINADIASASFESEEDVHDEDQAPQDQEVY